MEKGWKKDKETWKNRVLTCVLMCVLVSVLVCLPILPASSDGFWLRLSVAVGSAPASTKSCKQTTQTSAYLRGVRCSRCSRGAR